MESGLIEVQDIAIEEAVESLLQQDQKMIQTFSSHTPQKTFKDAIHRREFGTGGSENVDAT
jgi:hypothetical protein